MSEMTPETLREIGLAGHASVWEADRARIEALEKALYDAKMAGFVEAKSTISTALTVFHAVGLVVDAALAEEEKKP